jgi:hypothetical protein
MDNAVHRFPPVNGRHSRVLPPGSHCIGMCRRAEAAGYPTGIDRPASDTACRNSAGIAPSRRNPSLDRPIVGSAAGALQRRCGLSCRHCSPSAARRGHSTPSNSLAVPVPAARRASQQWPRSPRGTGWRLSRRPPEWCAVPRRSGDRYLQRRTPLCYPSPPRAPMDKLGIMVIVVRNFVNFALTAGSGFRISVRPVIRLDELPGSRTTPW